MTSRPSVSAIMRETVEEWKRPILVFVAIFILGLALRLGNLNSLPVFGDEAIYIRWAQIMRTEPTLRFLPLSDGKQPLFMWLIIPFLKVFSDPLVAGRMVSAAAGMGTMVGIYVFSFLLFKSHRVSLLSSFVYAISPMSIFFDRLALADSMLGFFVAWTLVFSVIAVKWTRLDAAIFAGFSLGGAFITKSPALFIAILLPITWILPKWSIRKIVDGVRLIKLVFLFLVIYFLALLIYNILRLGPNFHMLSSRTLDYVYPFSHIFESTLDPLLPFLHRILQYFWILGPWPLVFLIALGTYHGLRKSWRETLLLLIMLFVPIFVVAEFSKIMTTRYIYFVFGFVAILSGLSFVNIKFRFTGPNLFSKMTILLMLIFSICALYIDCLLLTNPAAAPLPRSERSGYLEEWTAGHGIREVSLFVREEYQQNPQQKIVVGTEGYFGALPDGLQMYLNDLPAITVIGVGIDIDELPVSLAESKAFGNKTYLVINTSRLRGDPDKMGLKLVAEYTKATKPDGEVEKLLFFEVK